MGWGGSAGSRWDLASFEDLHKALKSARNHTNGKPLESNTRAFLREGTLDKPTVIAVRLHYTDILRFHSDGSLEVSKSSWVGSMLTKERLRGYGRMTVQQCRLPLHNGLQTFPNVAVFVQPYHHKERIAIATGRYNNPEYLLFDANRNIDMSTVTPHVVDGVKDSKKLRKLMAQLHKLSRLAVGYAKLADNLDVFERGQGQLHDWLIERLHIPLEEVQLSPFPRVFTNRGSSLKASFDAAIKSLRRSIAMREQCLEPVEVYRLD